MDRGITASPTSSAARRPGRLGDRADTRLPDICVTVTGPHMNSSTNTAKTSTFPRMHASFEVLPRMDATKKLGVRKPDNGRVGLMQRELILKVRVEPPKPTRRAGVPASQRRVKTGATLALLWSDGQVLALVRSSVTDPAQGAAREQFLTRIVGLATPR